MEITYDKKQYRKIEKSVLEGKKRYAIKQALIGVIVNILSVLFVMFIFNEEESSFNIGKTIIIILIIPAISFVPLYFLQLWNFKHIVKIYTDTKDYWEKHDPSFFDGEKYEKID